MIRLRPLRSAEPSLRRTSRVNREIRTILAMEFDHLTVVLLIRGENAPDLTDEEERALQDAHLAHLADLHQAGHLVAAGPLRDPDSYYRGLSILTVGVEEARALKEADPAVRAGKFRVVALPWMVPAGALRFSPTKFPRSIAEASGSG
jgi:uncharacterized protein